jgi:hypothetical protein
MKRDLDLIRKILLKTEDSNLDEALTNIQVEGYESDEIAYNISLLKNAGFLEGEILYEIGSVVPSAYIIFGMTWLGHDFLDACRNEGIWAKAKEKIRTIGNDVPIEVIKAVLIEIMKKQLIGS